MTDFAIEVQKKLERLLAGGFRERPPQPDVLYCAVSVRDPADNGRLLAFAVLHHADGHGGIIDAVRSNLDRDEATAVAGRYTNLLHTVPLGDERLPLAQVVETANGFLRITAEALAAAPPATVLH